MPADPADIGRLTTDGVVITTDPAAGAAIRAIHADAQPLGDGTREVEMFFTNPAHAQAMLDEKFAALSIVDPVHEGIEIADRLLIGRDIAISPATPRFTIVDESRGISKVARLRAVAWDFGTDRYAIEVLE